MTHPSPRSSRILTKLTTSIFANFSTPVVCSTSSAVPIFLLDASDFPSTHRQLVSDSTAPPPLSLVSPAFDSPESAPLCPPDLCETFFPTSFTVFPLPLVHPLVPSPPFPSTLLCLSTILLEMSHHPAHVRCRSQSKLVHISPILRFWFAAAHVVHLHRHTHFFLTPLALARSCWSCMTPPFALRFS